MLNGENIEREVFRQCVYSMEKSEEFLSFLSSLPIIILDAYSIKLAQAWNFAPGVVKEELHALIDEFIELHPDCNSNTNLKVTKTATELTPEEFTEADKLEATKFGWVL